MFNAAELRSSFLSPLLLLLHNNVHFHRLCDVHTSYFQGSPGQRGSIQQNLEEAQHVLWEFGISGCYSPQTKQQILYTDEPYLSALRLC